MEEKLDKLWCKIETLYFKQGDVGLNSEEMQHLWELEKEYSEIKNSAAT